MGDIVNLRQARKAKLRAEREADARINRQVHGRSKTERASSSAVIDKAARFIDGHRRDEPAETDRDR